MTTPGTGCELHAQISEKDSDTRHAEQIHAALHDHPGGLTRSQISQTLNHNQPAGEIETALHALHAAGRVTATQIPTGGRPAQLWTATSS